MRLDRPILNSVALTRFPLVAGRIAGWRRKRDATLAAAGRWWGDRSPREHGLLAALAVVVSVAGSEQLVWQPLRAIRRAALVEIARDDRLAAQLRVAAPDVARVAAARAGTLPAIIETRAAKAGLTLARLEPQGGRVTVTLDGAGFDALVDWLDALDRDAGIVAATAKVDRGADPGVVTAEVTLTEQ